MEPCVREDRALTKVCKDNVEVMRQRTFRVLSLRVEAAKAASSMPSFEGFSEIKVGEEDWLDDMPVTRERRKRKVNKVKVVKGLGHEVLRRMRCVGCMRRTKITLLDCQASRKDPESVMCRECEVLADKQREAALKAEEERRREKASKYKLSKSELDHLLKTMSPW